MHVFNAYFLKCYSNTWPFGSVVYCQCKMSPITIRFQPPCPLWFHLTTSFHHQSSPRFVDIRTNFAKQFKFAQCINPFTVIPAICRLWVAEISNIRVKFSPLGRLPHHSPDRQSRRINDNVFPNSDHEIHSPVSLLLINFGWGAIP